MTDKKQVDISSLGNQFRQESSKDKLLKVVSIGLTLTIFLMVGALYLLFPLKREVPFILYLDRDSGKVERLASVYDTDSVQYIELFRNALTERYVKLRESYNIYTLRETVLEVDSMTAENQQDKYEKEVGASGYLGTLKDKFIISSRIISSSEEQANQLEDGQLVFTRKFELEKSVINVSTGEKQKTYRESVEMNYTVGGFPKEVRKDLLKYNPLYLQVTSYIKTRYE